MNHRSDPQYPVPSIPKSGEGAFTATIFVSDREAKQDILLYWNEVEHPGLIDVEYESNCAADKSVYDKYTRSPEDFPCGAPSDLQEQISDQIEYWVKRHMPGFEIRNCVEKEGIKPVSLFNQIADIARPKPF